MSLKMADLVEKSGVNKSTILYYVKEGLLPIPKKPKPNVHIYSKNSIAILEFIKSLQENMNYSILEIKSIIKDNKIDFQNDSGAVINYLSAISGKTQQEKVSQIKQLASTYDIDEELLQEYENTAKKLASLEYEMGAKLLTEHKNENNILQKLIFDIVLVLKPYIFNQATIKEHQVRVHG